MTMIPNRSTAFLMIGATWMVVSGCDAVTDDDAGSMALQRPDEAQLGRLSAAGVSTQLGHVAAHVTRPEPPVPPVPGFRSLKRVPVPLPSNLGELVSNRSAAIQLGKALYWDMQVGSDGVVACATCHHHAGADGRIKNQIRPRSPLAAGAVFFAGGPNWTPTAADFPFHRLADPNDAASPVLFDGGSNRMASNGVVRRLFVDVRPGQAQDNGQLLEDPVWNVGGVRVRRSAIVNAPSNLNAIFNVRQLAAGQAYDSFNGVNTAGVRTPGARVVKVVGGSLTPVSIRLDGASLASQSVGPPLDPVEMSYAGRTFPKLGRKMVGMRPLAKQKVACDDSVLGPLVHHTGRGLVGDYAWMIRRAFRPEWWNANEMVVFTGGSTAERVAEGAGADAGTPGVHPNPGRPLTTDEYTAMEANFSLFWGVALMMYEATLVSDDAPFDRFLDGQGGLTAAQRRGMRIFYGQQTGADGSVATCSVCHSGPETTAATLAAVGPRPIERIVMADGGQAVRDTGFMSIGVRPSTEGTINGNSDPVFGPFSQTLWAQQGGNLGFALNPPLSPTERTALKGAMKAPTLRNAELTGPYFHTGGAATLRQVVDFYARGGDFAQVEAAHLDPSMIPLALTERDRNDLVEFLLTLTDDRVRREAAPFDHPQLFMPVGHVGDQHQVVDDGTGVAVDQMAELRAVGRSGGAPIGTFLGLDPRQP